MKKLLLSLVLDASVVMASDIPTDDLLAVATQGKTAGSQFEMSKSEMQKVDGGGWLTRYYYSRVYSRPFYDTRNSRNSYTRTYRNGSTYSWNNYRSGGYTWMRY
jgi:hypothetical protein